MANKNTSDGTLTASIPPILLNLPEDEPLPAVHAIVTLQEHGMVVSGRATRPVWSTSDLYAVRSVAFQRFCTSLGNVEEVRRRSPHGRSKR
jgi:hypothetical protein